MLELEQQINSTSYHSPQKRTRELDLSGAKATQTTINQLAINEFTDTPAFVTPEKDMITYDNEALPWSPLPKNNH